MSVVTDEMQLHEARRLRQLARAIVRNDLATLRRSLADRPLTRRLRDRAVVAAVDSAEYATDLARENRGVLVLTLAGIGGWLFRKPLGALAQTGWHWAERMLARWRH